MALVLLKNSTDNYKIEYIEPSLQPVHFDKVSHLLDGIDLDTYEEYMCKSLNEHLAFRFLKNNKEVGFIYMYREGNKLNSISLYLYDTDIFESSLFLGYIMEEFGSITFINKAHGIKMSSLADKKLLIKNFLQGKKEIRLRKKGKYPFKGLCKYLGIEVIDG